MKRKNHTLSNEEPGMIKKTTAIAVSILFSAILMEPAQAAFRCGTHLLVTGEAKTYEVLKKCGDPKERLGNTWIYEKSGFTHELRFDRNGVLLDINRQ